MYGMTFNGIKKDYVVTLRGKRRPAWAPIKHNPVYVPEMPGAYNERTDTEPRPLSIPILIESNNLRELKPMTEEVANWLVTKEPKELIFDDEPNRVYYAQIEGGGDIEDIIRVGAGILNFVCYDPYKYRIETSGDLSYDLTQPLVLGNQGGVDVPPIFDVTLSGETTYIDIIGSDSYMRVGRTKDMLDVSVKPRQRVLWDDMSDRNRWIKAESGDIDGGVVAGNMTSTGYFMRQLDYGTGSAWHGDALIRSLPTPLKDFEIEYKVELRNPEAINVGRVELYFLDSAKRCLGKMAIKDTKSGRDGNYAEFRVGDKVDGRYILTGHGATIDTWLNFDGILTMKRKGNEWEAYIAKINAKGEHVARKRVSFEDIGNQFMGDVAYVVIHMAAIGNIPPAPMLIHDLKIYELNENIEQKVEIIGEAGDIFVFDHKREIVTKNGEPFMKKDMGSKFFKLVEGDNVFKVEPSSVIASVKTVWREGFK